MKLSEFIRKEALASLISVAVPFWLWKFSGKNVFLLNFEIFGNYGQYWSGGYIRKYAPLNVIICLLL